MVDWNSGDLLKILISAFRFSVIKKRWYIPSPDKNHRGIFLFFIK
jgi:hypothetical protein